MVSLYRLSQRRLPALFAILAILLLFIAPDISQSLMQRQASDDASETSTMAMGEMHGQTMAMHDMPMHGMAMDDMADGMAATAAPHQSPHDASPHHAMPMGMMDDFACGYCQLLVHVPMLVWLFTPAILLLLLTGRAPPVRPLPVYHPTVYLSPCQPRAPPSC